MSELLSPSTISTWWVFNVSLKWEVLRSKISGRYAVSGWLVAGSTPFLVGGFFAVELPEDATANQAQQLLLVALLGQLALAAVFGLAATTLLRRSRRSPLVLWRVLAVYLVAGEVRALVLVAGLDFAQLPNSVPLWVRLVNSALLITVTFALSSSALESLRRYFDTRAALVESIVVAETQLGRQIVRTDKLGQTLLAKMERKISSANEQTVVELSTLRENILRGENPREELLNLLQKADSRWRGISHSAWEQAKIRVPRIRGRELFTVLAASRPLSYLYLFVGGLFLYSSSLVRVLPFPEASGWLLAWYVLVVPLTWLVNTAPIHSTRPVGAFLFTYLLYLGVGGAFFAIPGFPPEEALGASVVHITIAITMVIVGGGPALSQSQENILHALRRQLDERTLARLRVESELVIAAQKVSARLHANTRGLFLAGVLRLQRFLDEGETAGAMAELENLSASLQNIEPERSSTSDWSDLVSFLDNWDGLVNLSSNLDDIVVSSHLETPIANVVVNAVNDAVRHGKATRVDVNISLSESEWIVTVVNDGDMTPGSYKAGMGDSALERLATAGWARQSSNSGLMCLTARFALAQP